MENKRLPAIILAHVHKNILDNINLAELNSLTEKKAANKNSDIFLRIIHNICKITLILKYFLSIYISYQMYKM